MRKKVSVRQKEMAKKAPLAKKPATKWELDEQCLNQHLGLHGKRSARPETLRALHQRAG
jgi:hypothetical protein